MNLLKIGDRTFELGKRTVIMGILNVTPDSFSDGGKFFAFDDAVKQAVKMQKEGADIIDIGGESTRPGAKVISLEEEMDRVTPIVEELVKKIRVPLSVDTYKSEIAKKALDLGASMVNDVSALRSDKNLASVVAEYDVPICLMHMKGSPRNMQVDPVYDDVVREIYDFLKERSEYAISCKIKKENIVVDPGLGFGKRTGCGIEDNCEILQRLSEFRHLGFPVLVGASRKTFIGNVYGGGQQLPVTNRLEGSIASACIAAMKGADIVRVHDVKETRKALEIVDCVRGIK